MNRILLAGSAVVALALGTGSAFAQSKFEVRMGGDAVFEAAATSQDRDTNRRSVDFVDRVRLNTVATGKADNGLQYGVRLRLRSMGGSGGSNTVDSDRAYIFVSGGFGQVKMGTTDSLNDDIIPGWAGTTPYGWQTTTLFLNFLGALHASGGNATSINTTLMAQTLTDNSNASKVVYFSPKFSGFQVGGSYTPNSSSSGYNIDRSETATSGYQDIWEIGANYDNTFSGVGLKLIAGYMGGQAKDAATTAREDLSALQVGGKISYAGFSIGGNYINKWDSGLAKSYQNKDDQEIWSAGLEYVAGPVTIGGAYVHGKGNIGTYGTATTTSGGVTRYTGSVEQSVWQLGALYTVAPGLLVGAEYNYIDADAPGTVNDDKANVFMLRSAVVF